MAKKKEWDTAALQAALLARYPLAQGYATFLEVRDAAGYDSKRSADAVVCGLWASRGQYLTGFEIKSDRGDWLRELKNPQKAEAVAQYCDYWYLLCGPDVAKEEEVPHAWGLMMPHGSGLREIKKPEKREPKPMTPGFRASIFRSACREVDKRMYVPRSEFDERVHERWEHAKSVGRAECEREIRDLKRELASVKNQYAGMRADVRRFEELTGLTVSYCFSNVADANWRDLILAIKLAREGNISQFKNNLRSVAALCGRMVEGCSAMEAVVDAVQAKELELHHIAEDPYALKPVECEEEGIAVGGEHPEAANRTEDAARNQDEQSAEVHSERGVLR